MSASTGSARMKVLRWYKLGEPVPADATLIKTERREGKQIDDDALGPIFEMEEWALYEVPLP